jgi:hypothetical protein
MLSKNRQNNGDLIAAGRFLGLNCHYRLDTMGYSVIGQFRWGTGTMSRILTILVLILQPAFGTESDDQGDSLQAGMVNPGYHEQPAWFRQSFLDIREDMIMCFPVRTRRNRVFSAISRGASPNWRHRGFMLT